MGGGGSRSRTPPTPLVWGIQPLLPPPSPTFKEPWRKISWRKINRDEDQDLQYVKNYQPQNEDVKHLRILLYGPVGAGKSSFISAVSSVLRGRITTPALANASIDNQSFTTKYKVHKISKGGRGNFYPFVFSDIMGLEEESGRGASVEDLKLILAGHMKNGYKFNPVSPLSCGDQHYNPSPSLDDKVHVLVWIGPADTGELSDSVLQKMKAVRKAASEMGIPQLAIATKVDEAYKEVGENLQNVYMSKNLKTKMTHFSSVLGIPLSCIFPVKNYSHEISSDDDVDCLILSALRMMIDLGDDFINEM